MAQVERFPAWTRRDMILRDIAQQEAATMTKQTIAAWVERLARQILVGEVLQSFLALSLKDRVFGIAFFGALGDEHKVKEEALHVLNYLETIEG